MSETNKVMSSLQFPNTDQPYQVNDARVPANPAPYQQLVTDGEGNWGTADRLAWIEQQVLIEEQTVDLKGGAVFAEAFVKPEVYIPIENGKAYVLSLDQVQYESKLSADGKAYFDTPTTPGWLTIVESLDDTQEYKISETGGSNFTAIIGLKAAPSTHPIPAEYLPDGIGSFVVKVIQNWDENGEITCDKTFAEIKAAIESGVNVTCLYYTLEEGMHYFLGRYNQAWFGWDNFDNQCAVIYGFVGDMSNGSYYAGLKFTESGTSYISDKDLAFGRSRLYLQGDFFVGSSTPGSNKVFRIMVDDSGTITAQALPE